MLYKGNFRISAGPKKVDVTGGRSELHNKFHNPYSSSGIIKVIKSRVLN
jgi:hypothetical protein